MAYLHVIDRAGRMHKLETVEGWRVMEILRDQKVGIDGQCGGACLCATCHVIVAPEWIDRLPGPREDELEQLDALPVVGPTSRLSCQILWSDRLDGLTVTLPEPF